MIRFTSGHLCTRLLLATLFLLAVLGTGGASFGADLVVVPTADYPRPDHPEIGINLENLSNTARSMMFVDAMKSAGGIGPLKKPEEEAPPKAGAKLPAKSKPKTPPSTDLGVDVIVDTAVPPGDYLFFCSGVCTVSATSQKASVTKQDYTPQTNTTTATITVEPGATALSLAFTGIKAGSRISEVRLLRPGYPAGTEQIFTKEFLEAIKPFSVIRINGIPLDYGIRLANQTGKDIWISVPASATDDSIKQLAHFTYDKLNRDRNLYIEYSNQSSNSATPATQPAAANALPKMPEKVAPSEEAPQQTASRTIEISNFFRSAWGARTINTRVRVVLLVPTTNPLKGRDEMEFIEKTYGPPSKFIYGVAEAPYITIDAKTNLGDDLTPDNLFKLLTASLNVLQDSTLQFQTLARYYRVHHMAYEGGPSLVGEHSFEAKNKASRDPRMTPLLADYLTRWFAQGDELFMYYNLASPYGKFNSWGLTDTINVPSVKTAAIDKILAGPLPIETGGTSVPSTFSAAQFNAASRDVSVKVNTTAEKDIISLRADYWFDYLLNVKESGNYRLTLKSASLHGGTVDAVMSGQPLGTLQCPTTGDWKKWADSDAIHLQLEKGQIVLRLKIAKPGMNIRSITIEKEPPPAH